MDRLFGKFKNLAESTKLLAANTRQLATTTLNQLQQQPLSIVEITPRLFWMDYPSPDKIQAMAKHLNGVYANNYYVWNVGERSFATEWFQNQVANHSHPGFPCPPLIELLTICKNILFWLSSDPDNICVICCQETRGRSILIISSLLSLMGAGHPGECLLKVCQLTNTQDYQALFPSQHLYLTFVGNLMTGLKLNNSRLRLVSIVFQTIPTIQNQESFRPYIQLYQNEKILYNSLQEQELKSYTRGEQSCIFEFKGVELCDDILVRCKHFENNATRIAMFRFMFNCNFLFDNVYRVWARDLDKSSQMQVNNDFFIDFIFERGNQKSFQTADLPQQYNAISKPSNSLLQQIVQDCRGIVVREPSVANGLITNFTKQEQLDKQDVFSIGTDDKESHKEKDIYKEEVNDINDKPQVEVVQVIQPEQPGISRISVESKEELNEENNEEEPIEQNQIVSKILQQIHQDKGEDEDDEDIDDFINQLEQQE